MAALKKDEMKIKERNHKETREQTNIKQPRMWREKNGRENKQENQTCVRVS